MNKVDWTKPIEGMNYEGQWLSAVVEDGAADDCDPTRGIRLSDGCYRHVDENGCAVAPMFNHEVTARNAASADDTVAVKRMTVDEADDWIANGPDGKTLSPFGVLWRLGLIKANPSPLEQFLADHPDADRTTAELAFARWGGE